MNNLVSVTELVRHKRAARDSQSR